MIVDIDQRQRADIDFKLRIPRNHLGQSFIQPMNALHHQDVAGPHGKYIAPVVALARLEIIVWDPHRLAIHQPYNVLIKLLCIDGLQRFKVWFSILIKGRFIPINKIIIHGNHVGPHTFRPQLNGKFPGKGRFPGGGWACNQHKLDPVRPAFVSSADIGDPLGVKRL